MNANYCTAMCKSCRTLNPPDLFPYFWKIFICLFLCKVLYWCGSAPRVTLESGEMEWVNFLMEALRQSQHSPALTSTPTSLPNLKKQNKQKKHKTQKSNNKLSNGSTPPISTFSRSHLQSYFSFYTSMKKNRKRKFNLTPRSWKACVPTCHWWRRTATCLIVFCTKCSRF